ncbi:lysis protein, partial [Escherichia coli]
KKVSELEQANATITDMQQRQRDVAALDEKYSRELADAKAENDALRDDIAAGRRRLRIRAVCPAVREATGTTGVDDAARPGLTDAAQRDYFTLRERIATSDRMIRGLQEYIRTQCIK